MQGKEGPAGKDFHSFFRKLLYTSDSGLTSLQSLLKFFTFEVKNDQDYEGNIAKGSYFQPTELIMN